MYHSVIPSPTTFLTVAKEIREFIDKNPSEFIILDFQHFRNQPYEQMTQIIEEILLPDKYALKRPLDILTMTMGDIRKTLAKHIVVWGSHSSYLNLDKDYIYYRGETLFSPYVESFHNQSEQTLINEGFDHYYSLQDERFFVLQSQKTGNTSDLSRISIFANEQRFLPFAEEFIEGLQTHSRLHDTNIIMRNFLNDEKTKSIIDLNLYKNTIDNAYIHRLKKL